MVDSQNLTVLVPGFNCVEDLERHSEKLASLRKCGAKIVWLITPGFDGTKRQALAIAKRTGDDFLQAPKGLYEAWNYGIASVKTKYLYFSTINDFPIQHKVLNLRDVLELTGADICFSPPARRCPRGLKNKLVLTWPVYRYRNFLSRFTDKPIPTTALIAMQVNSGLSCLLGSWASTVARTSFLKQRPFSNKFGHHSDTLWMYNHLLEAKVVYYPDPVAFFAPWSSFKKNEFSDDQLVYQYRRCVIDLFRNSKKRNLWLKQSFDRFRTYFSLFFILNRLRGVRPKRFWWLNPIFCFVRVMREFAAWNLQPWQKHWKIVEPSRNK